MKGGGTNDQKRQAKDLCSLVIAKRACALWKSGWVAGQEKRCCGDFTVVFGHKHESPGIRSPLH